MLEAQQKNIGFSVDFFCGVVHDADFRQSEKDFDSFVEKLTENLMEKDGTIPELPPKDLVCWESVEPTSVASRLSKTRNSAYIETFDSVKILRLTRFVPILLT